MYKVNVQNTCRCFIKSGMVESQTFDTKEEAQKEAKQMISKMQSSFCQQHEFALSEMLGDFTIFIKPRR